MVLRVVKLDDKAVHNLMVCFDLFSGRIYFVVLSRAWFVGRLLAAHHAEQTIMRRGAPWLN